MSQYCGSLDGKVALITGGGRGIGRAIVEQFVDAGACVVTCGRGERPGDLPDGVAWVSADVADPSSVSALHAAVEQRYGVATILVNNAGVQVERTVIDSSEEDWATVVGVNCRGVFNTCRRFIPGMLEAGEGRIVNIGSISGTTADPAMALYNASKGFVHALTRSVAVDHGPTVRCNAICPGWILTGMTDAAFAVATDPAASQRDAIARHPLRRFGTPADIARVAHWLCSEESSFVTGACLTVDGGLTAASPLQPGLF